ncbi:MAG: tetratricopeptide repeat protein [Bacteroidetes bacterium]|nr:tetratricopeptide repeat protein [Bacteroidota bacterium]
MRRLGSQLALFGIGLGLNACAPSGPPVREDLLDVASRRIPEPQVAAYEIYGQNLSQELSVGIRLYAIGQYTPAEMRFRQVLARNPRDFSANYWLARVLYTQERYQESRVYFQYALRYLDPSTPNYTKLQTEITQYLRQILARSGPWYRR